MKKQTPVGRLWNDIHSSSLHKRHLNSIDKKRFRNRQVSARRAPVQYKRENILIQLPKIVSLRIDDFRDLCHKISNATNFDRKITLDFGNVRSYRHGGVLHLYALIDLYQDTTKRQVSVARLPQGKREKELMTQLGYYDLLGRPELRLEPKHEQVVNWRLERAGTTSSITIESIYQECCDKLDTAGISAIDQAQLYESAIESASNIEHAYPDSKGQNPFYALYSITETGFNFAIVDLGVGFAKTVPKLRKRDIVLDSILGKIGTAPSDAKYIQSAVAASMQHAKDRDNLTVTPASQSATGLAHRNYGLNNIAQFANLENSAVKIHSGTGYYYRNHDNLEAPITETIEKFSSPIVGSAVILAATHSL